ncbi:hypothetical protein [Lactobacillus delbrueckii]|uniref:hypothetical protein n=1 Tax=Lactobacillus delbrueckii TaxID=1584 RepID=UPI0021688BFB|nr:hypothetical protein [Lactobacillus delbrueckii]
MESVDIFHLLWRSMNEKQKVECSNKLSLAMVIMLYWKCEQSMTFSERIQKKAEKIASPLAGLVKIEGNFIF